MKMRWVLNEASIVARCIIYVSNGTCTVSHTGLLHHQYIDSYVHGFHTVYIHIYICIHIYWSNSASCPEEPTTRLPSCMSCLSEHDRTQHIVTPSNYPMVYLLFLYIYSFVSSIVPVIYTFHPPFTINHRPYTYKRQYQALRMHSFTSQTIHFINWHTVRIVRPMYIQQFHQTHLYVIEFILYLYLYLYVYDYIIDIDVDNVGVFKQMIVK